MTTPTVQKSSAAAPMALPQNQKATNQTIKPLTQPYTPQASKPSNEAMVEKRIGGLLDPNNPLMRKAVAQSQQFAARRGLQSSSIANESALSSMIDKAQGIASQDANTVAQFERDNASRTHESGMQSNQQSWQSGENVLGRAHDMSVIDKNNTNQVGLLQMQQQFQAGENKLGREHETSLADKQTAAQREMAALQNQYQLGQLNVQGQQRMAELAKQAEYQSIENSASREFQKTMQDLQYQQQLGVLDVQGKQQLQQMERNAQLTSQRDATLQKYQKELNTQQNQQRIAEIDKELNARKDMLRTELDARTYSEYNNAISTGYNNMLAQMGAIYSNPEMTPEQQAAGVAKITEMFKAQQAQLETLYGLKKPTPASPSTGVKPTNPTIPNPAKPSPQPQPTPTPRPPSQQNPIKERSHIGDSLLSKAIAKDKNGSGQKLLNGSPIQNVGAPVQQRFLER